MSRRKIAKRRNPSTEMTLVVGTALGTIAAATVAAVATSVISDTTPAKRVVAGALLGVLGGGVVIAGTLVLSVARSG